MVRFMILASLKNTCVRSKNIDTVTTETVLFILFLTANCQLWDIWDLGTKQIVIRMNEVK